MARCLSLFVVVLSWYTVQGTPFKIGLVGNVTTEVILSDLSKEKYPEETFNFFINISNPGENFYSEYMQIVNENDVALIVGEYSSRLRLVAETFHVPYLVVSLHLASIGIRDDFSFFLYPNPGVLEDALGDVLDVYGWERVGILYEGDPGLLVAGHIMSEKKIDAVIFNINLPTDDVTENIRHLLLNLRQLRIKEFIIITSLQKTQDILTQALGLSMLSHQHAWILVTLHPERLDLSPYINTQVNMTTFALPYDREEPNPLYGHAIIEDALYLTSSIITDVQCHSNCSIGELRRYVQQYLAKVDTEGLTGKLSFNANHQRDNSELEVLQLTADGLSEYGRWQENGTSHTERLRLGEAEKKIEPNITHVLGRDVAKIAILQERPFIMRKEKYHNLTGNDRFEGFLIDLIQVFAEKLDFKYELYEVPDGKYGAKQDDGDWNGLIKELMNGNATMCLAAITITSERETVVDFTIPFAPVALDILIQRPMKKTSMFQFFWPFSLGVWLLIGGSLIVAGFFVFILDWFSPNGDDGQRAFNLKKSMWFAYGSLVCAGSEVIPPKTYSGRIFTGTWWFVSMILIASYTANLAAFLTVTNIEIPITSADELASQSKIKYGSVKDSSIVEYIEHSSLETFKQMASYFELHPDVLVKNTDEGIERVKTGEYAFIWDEPINKYISGQECDTMNVGDPFNEKGYGIGVPQGSPYRDQLSMVILELLDEEVFTTLEMKWWPQAQCKEFQSTTNTDTTTIGLENLAGAFIVLAGGMGIAIVVCFAEMLYNRSQDRKNKELPSSNGTNGSLRHTNGHLSKEGSHCDSTTELKIYL